MKFWGMYCGDTSGSWSCCTYNASLYYRVLPPEQDHEPVQKKRHSKPKSSILKVSNGICFSHNYITHLGFWTKRPFMSFADKLRLYASLLYTNLLALVVLKKGWSQTYCLLLNYLQKQNKLYTKCAKVLGKVLGTITFCLVFYLYASEFCLHITVFIDKNTFLIIIINILI